MGDARAIALGQLNRIAEDLGAEADVDQRLKVASCAVRLAECDKRTVYLHRHESERSEDGGGV